MAVTGGIHLIGAGTPMEAATRGRLLLFVVYRENTLAIVILAADELAFGVLILTTTAEPR